LGPPCIARFLRHSVVSSFASFLKLVSTESANNYARYTIVTAIFQLFPENDFF